MTYNTIKIEELEWWYRVTGNRHGWNLFVQKPSTPQNPIQNSIKFPFWEKPNDKQEARKFIEDMVKEVIELYGKRI